MKNTLKLMLVVFALVTLNSCKKDKENPTTIISQPINHSTHAIGSEVHLVASFEDDQALRSYHIYMRNVSGDHMPEFDLEFEADITGKTFDFHEHFIVPTGISSVYYLHFEVIDEDGKIATDKVMLEFM